MDDRNRYKFYSADRVSEANSLTAICSPLVFDEGLMVELKRSERAGDPISLGRRFSAERVAANYLFRPPYPPEVYDILLDLMREHPRILLDAGCVDRLMATVALKPAAIDSVFLTGGSSFVPAVRRIFIERFGADRIRLGDEFTSVARGLALRALDDE